MPSTPSPFPGGMPAGFPPFSTSLSTPPNTDAPATPPIEGKRNLVASIEREEDTKAAAQLDANPAGLWASTTFTASSTSRDVPQTPKPNDEAAAALINCFTKALTTMQGQGSPNSVAQLDSTQEEANLPVSVVGSSALDTNIPEGWIPGDKRMSSFTRSVGNFISKLLCRIDQKSVVIPIRDLARIEGKIDPLINALIKRLPAGLQKAIPTKPTNAWVAGFSSDPDNLEFKAYKSLQNLVYFTDVAVMAEVVEALVDKAAITRHADIIRSLGASLNTQEPPSGYLLGILNDGAGATNTYRIINQAMSLTMPVSQDSFDRDLEEYNQQLKTKIYSQRFNIVDYIGPFTILFEEMEIKKKMVKSSETIRQPVDALRDQINDEGILDPFASRMVLLLTPLMTSIDAGVDKSLIIEKASAIQTKIDEYWLKQNEALEKERAITKAHAASQAKSTATALYTSKPSDGEKAKPPKPPPKDKAPKLPKDPATAAMIKMCTSRSVDGLPTKEGGQHPCISWNLCIANGGSPAEAEKACTDNPRRKVGADGKCIHHHGKAQECKVIAPPSGAEDMSKTD